MTERRAGCSSSTREMRRATARGEPSRAAATSAGTSTGRAIGGRSGLRDADDEGIALTAPAAQGRRTHTAAAPLELLGEGEDDPGAGHTERVAQGDGAAVGVDDLGVDPEQLGRRQADGRER